MIHIMNIKLEEPDCAQIMRNDRVKTAVELWKSANIQTTTRRPPKLMHLVINVPQFMFKSIKHSFDGRINWRWEFLLKVVSITKKHTKTVEKSFQFLILVA